MSETVTFNEKTGNFHVKGRLLWNHLFKRRPGTNDAGEKTEGKFELSVAIPTSTDMKALLAKVAEKGKEKFPKQFADAKGKWPSGVANPIKKTDSNDKLADITDEFSFYIDARDKDRPGVVWANGKKITMVGDVEREVEPSDVYAGRWVKVAFDVYAYDKKKKGVSFGLKSVQLLDDDEELVIGGGRVSAESEFEDATSGAAAGGSSDSMFE